MFHIKISGITTPDDARMVAQDRRDAAGLNFFPPQPSLYFSGNCPRKSSAELPEGVVRVGLFVNAAAANFADGSTRCRSISFSYTATNRPNFWPNWAAGRP